MQFLEVDKNSDANRFLWKAHEGAQSQGYQILNEVGSNIRVQGRAGLFGEDRVHSSEAPLHRLCPWRNLDFEGAQVALVQLGRRADVRVICRCRVGGIDSTRISTSSVQCKIYHGGCGGSDRVPEAEECFVSSIIVGPT